MNGSGKPILALVCGRGLAFAATFLTPVILVRVFDQAQFGTYKQFFLLWSTFYALGQFGMAESLFYFLPRTPEKGGRYVANSGLFLATAGLLGLGMLSVGRNALSSWLGNAGLSAYTILAGCFLAFTLASGAFEIVMITRKQYVRAAFTYGLSDLLRAACFIVPALIFRRLVWVFFGAVAFAFLRFGAALVYLRREYDGELRPDLSALKEQLAYVVPFGAAVILDVVQANYHQYAVSHLFGAGVFAVYSVGCLNIPLVDLVTNPTSSVMMVRMAEAIREGKEGDAAGLWRDTTRKLGLILVPLVGFVLLTGHDLIVLLFTESYIGSVKIFMIWSTGILWMALNTDGVLRVYAETRFILLLSALRLVLNVVLLAWFLHAYGVAGAALATVVAAAAGKILALTRMRQLLGTSWSDLLPWRSFGAIVAATCVAAVPVLALKAQAGPPSISLLIGGGLVYGATLVALLVHFEFLTDDERLAVATWLRTAGEGARQMTGVART
jgi:O-antigen/teichoic acid export membrane protein